MRWLLILLLSLVGCNHNPTPFATGVEAPPPAGCIEGRARGVDC